MQAFLKKCKETGVAGVKIDYFYDESQTGGAVLAKMRWKRGSREYQLDG
ncbi:MAG: hypothetical protein ACLTZY_04860 [Alistipes indistinctus]